MCKGVEATGHRLNGRDHEVEGIVALDKRTQLSEEQKWMAQLF